MNLRNHIVALCAACLLLSACGKSDEAASVATQATNIEAFIEAMRAKGYDCWFYDDVYHVRLEEGVTTEAVRVGDTIVFDYTAATFNKSNEQGLGWIFDTNIKAVAQSNHLNTNRTFEPQRAIAGRQGYIQGLERGLQRVRKGETVLIVFTSDLGYGDSKLSLIPRNTPLVFRVKMVDVKKTSL